jgi:hypothetical protein
MAMASPTSCTLRANRCSFMLHPYHGVFRPRESPAASAREPLARREPQRAADALRMRAAEHDERSRRRSTPRPRRAREGRQARVKKRNGQTFPPPRRARPRGGLSAGAAPEPRAFDRRPSPARPAGGLPSRRPVANSFPPPPSEAPAPLRSRRLRSPTPTPTPRPRTTTTTTQRVRPLPGDGKEKIEPNGANRAASDRVLSSVSARAPRGSVIDKWRPRPFVDALGRRPRI